MNKANILSVIFSCLVFFCFVNVLCLRGKNGSSASNSLESGSEFSQRINNSLSSFISGSATLDKVGDDLADNIASEIVSALQNEGASFLQSGFDVKQQLKTHAKKILLEAVKAGLGPVEKIVADSVKPPRTSGHVYNLLGPTLRTLFNKIEDAVHKPVPDSIWDYEGEDLEDEDESSDDFLN
ncbi:cell traversal protein for ookinetes and sporozoites [Plasmodium ovale curtisi]|uniref:Cell traversal protein for ookinetes and sporozoites n=1 Tax=Plasmodium ovale curtisi TaxID=864141 RepID=A0A1A8X4B1_PLAOA|nr:cell traversal protein for ookinetes and sporozoites [Plasmodium ovale curtisi]SBT00077.1 cell traversal protein for ookinetes and sporozoites [Plasmodium ovale curtisi]